MTCHQRISRTTQNTNKKPLIHRRQSNQASTTEAAKHINSTHIKMHFLSLVCTLASITTLFGTSWAAPVNHAYHAARPANTTAIETRQLQVLVEVASIVEAAKTVLDGIEAIIDVIDGDIHQAEGDFTQNLVANLRNQYPTMNVLVYHDQDCGYNLVSATHAHVEMDIIAGFSQGYEVWVFDYGTFELVGDGGYSNWAIGGSFDGPSSDVTFYSMNGN